MSAPPEEAQQRTSNSHVYFNPQKDICIARIYNINQQETSVSLDPELVLLLHLLHDNQHTQSFAWLRYQALKEGTQQPENNKDKTISNSRTVQRLIIRRALQTLSSIRQHHPQIFQQHISTQNHENNPTQAQTQDLRHPATKDETTQTTSSTTDPAP